METRRWESNGKYSTPHPAGSASRTEPPCGTSPLRTREARPLIAPAGGEGKPPSPAGGEGKAGRRLGELVLGRGVRLGKGSACLSLGRGTQPSETWATICCVPSEVITPNVVVVKIFGQIS